MKVVGFDIGTTTICGIVIDTALQESRCVRSIENDTWITGQPYERMQDAEKICRIVSGLYEAFVREYPDIAVIGLTGQMHGIVYVDAEGEAVSPLYTWQDERGNLPVTVVEKQESPRISKKEGMCEALRESGAENRRSQILSVDKAKTENPSGKCDAENEGHSSEKELAKNSLKSYAAILSEKTGCPMATGYGLTTHFWMMKNGQIPAGAVSICNIHDYIGMRLTGRKQPLMTASDAVGLGCFDLESGCFDTKAVLAAGMDPSFLPEVTGGFALLGCTRDGIPVAAAIGDNQASVIGSVKEPEGSLLINIGTSSQVSIGVKGYREHAGIELRPMVNDAYIFVGAGLCGGRAYAMLERFFAQTVEAMTGKKPDGLLYERMAELLERRGREQSGLEPRGEKWCESERRELEQHGPKWESLRVDTRFCGTRENPEQTGAIRGITPFNFTPGELTFGVLYGMAEELISFYRVMRRYGAPLPKQLIGSGNAIRNNPYLRGIFEEYFRMPMQVPHHREEAACGAALYALTGSGKADTLQEAQEWITYE